MIGVTRRGVAGLMPLGMAVTTSAQAQPVVGPAPIVRSERHLLKATHIDQVYQIDVLPVISPTRPPAPGARIPVVVALDGNLTFSLLAGLGSFLTLGDIPSILVVAVGYALSPARTTPGGFLEVQALRTRDYTPSVDATFLEQARSSVKRFGADYPANGQPGGAAAFRAFLQEELKPFIGERYPMADLDRSILLGASFGGLLAIDALLKDPTSYWGYIAASPSLWWDDAILLRQYRPPAEANGRLFMSLGGLEPEVPMAGPVRRLDARLRGDRPPGLAYTFQLFPDETHGSGVAAAFSRGLRAVLA